MELYNIYCGFWEGMKEISVGVCLNEYNGWKFVKKKSGLFKKTNEKEKEKKNGLEQKQKKMMRKKKRRKRKKKVKVQFELYCVKLVELMIFEKKKNCAPLVFRNYIVPYIYFFFIVKPLTFVASLQPC